MVYLLPTFFEMIWYMKLIMQPCKKWAGVAQKIHKYNHFYNLCNSFTIVLMLYLTNRFMSKLKIIFSTGKISALINKL
jgi:hypothetical protein